VDPGSRSSQYSQKLQQSAGDDDAKIEVVTFYYIMFGGMVLFGVVVYILDWLGRRQERHREHR